MNWLIPEQTNRSITPSKEQLLRLVVPIDLSHLHFICKGRVTNRTISLDRESSFMLRLHRENQWKLEIGRSHERHSCSLYRLLRNPSNQMMTPGNWRRCGSSPSVVALQVSTGDDGKSQWTLVLPYSSSCCHRNLLFHLHLDLYY